MADGIGPCHFEDAGHRLRVDDVGNMEGYAGGQIVAGAAGEVVEHLHPMAGRQQAIDDVAADESGAAGDEDVHGLSFAV